MSIHIDKIENHAVHNSIKNLTNEISAIKSITDNPLNVVETIARISLVIENFCVALENSNKELIALSWLNDVSNACINLKSRLTTFKGNKDLNALANNTPSLLDTILRCTVYLNCVKSAQTFRGVANSTEKYIKTISEYNKQLDIEVEQLKDKIDKFGKLIEEHLQSSSTNLSELKTSIDTEKQRLDAIAISHQNQMADDKKDYIGLRSEFKEDFSASQSERKATFEAEIEENANVRKTFAENANQQIENIKQSSEQVIKEYAEKFANFEKEVENIVGIVNTNMFSHKYKEVADDAHKRARFWHFIAVILMLVEVDLQYMLLFSQLTKIPIG